MRVPKLAGGPDGEIGLLGGAAPLSSRKTGYLLRVAHMIPIIFPAPPGSGSALHGTPLIGLACLATLLNAWGQLNFLQYQKQVHEANEIRRELRYKRRSRNKN